MKEVTEILGTSNRRSFIRNGAVAGAAATVGAGILSGGLRALAETDHKGPAITKGDIAILQFLAAAEIIESDLWEQYTELGGVQDAEEHGVNGGSPLYMAALQILDSDMPQYIHDNTEDELTHEAFINAYLASKGADTVNLDKFRTLPSSQATGSNKSFGRLTNLTQLTVDTTWWTRYRSRNKNPDFGDKFRPAIATLAVNQHTAIPRTDSDVSHTTFLKAVANTAGFHFAFIEQGGTSLYAELAQRVSNVEVLRILLSIGGTEICHFQTWHDKAGNAFILKNVVDPVTGVLVTFPDLNSPPFGGEDFQTNLIMPEPTVFLSRQFPAVSIIRPTETKGAAMGALKALTGDGLFIGQSKKFFQFLTELAQQADSAQHECD